jgi:deoxyribodipyrimidine photo-lyase
VESKKQQKEWILLGGVVTSSSASTRDILSRFQTGTTEIGLIGASQGELFLTGHTSQRARVNVASFLAEQLGIDWRIGAEWYEYLLVDYDVAIK